MITNPGWNKYEKRAYFHQLSKDCISKLKEVLTALSECKTDIETAFRLYEQILKDDISDSEFLNFALENLNELSSYLAEGNLNIRIHRNDVDEIWFDVE